MQKVSKIGQKPPQKPLFYTPFFGVQTHFYTLSFYVVYGRGKKSSKMCEKWSKNKIQIPNSNQLLKHQLQKCVREVFATPPQKFKNYIGVPQFMSLLHQFVRR